LYIRCSYSNSPYEKFGGRSPHLTKLLLEATDEDDCFTEELEDFTELLLCLLLDDEFTDELDLSLLLLEELLVFTELELLESDEFFDPFAELLDLFSLLDDLSLVSLPEDFLSIEEDDSSVESESFTLEDDSTADVSLLSPLADDESSQPQRPIPPNTAKKSSVLNLFIF